MGLLGHTLGLALQARGLGLGLRAGLDALGVLLGGIQLGVGLVLTLDAGGLGLLRALVEVGFGRLLCGVAVGLGLLLHGRVQLALPHVRLALGELDLLGLRGDLGLLLGDVELALLLGRHGGLHHIGLGLRLVGLLLEVGLLQVELVLADGDLLGRLDLRQLGFLFNLGRLIGAHGADDALGVGEVLHIEGAQLEAEVGEVILGAAEDLRVEALTVAHELLEVHLADDLAHLAQHDLGDLAGHLLFVQIQVVLGRGLDQLGGLADLEVRHGAGVDEDCVLRRDIVLGGQLHLHGTEREGVHALEERDHEGSLAGDGAHLAGAGDDHELIRRAFAPAALEHQHDGHDADGCGEQVEDQRFEKHHRVSFPSRAARQSRPVIDNSVGGGPGSRSARHRFSPTVGTQRRRRSCSSSNSYKRRGKAIAKRDGSKM